MATLKRFKCDAVNAVLTVQGCAQNWQNTKREGGRYAYRKAEKLPQCESCPIGEHHATAGTPHPGQSWHELTVGGAPAAASDEWKHRNPAAAASPKTDPAPNAHATEPKRETMPGKTKHSTETRAKALDLLANKTPVSEVAARFGVSTSTVYNWKKAAGSTSAPKKTPRPPVDQGPPVVLPKRTAPVRGPRPRPPGNATLPVSDTFATALPLRAGILVELRLPTDFTEDEAARLANFVRALALPSAS